MIEQVYFPVHGDKRPGTGVAVYGGFGYGNGKVDPVTLKADRPTDLFSQSLTTEFEEAAEVAHEVIREEIGEKNCVSSRSLVRCAD